MRPSIHSSVCLCAHIFFFWISKFIVISLPFQFIYVFCCSNYVFLTHTCHLAMLTIAGIHHVKWQRVYRLIVQSAFIIPIYCCWCRSISFSQRKFMSINRALDLFCSALFLRFFRLLLLPPFIFFNFNRHKCFTHISLTALWTMATE